MVPIAAMAASSCSSYTSAMCTFSLLSSSSSTASCFSKNPKKKKTLTPQTLRKFSSFSSASSPSRPTLFPAPVLPKERKNLRVSAASGSLPPSGFFRVPKLHEEQQWRQWKLQATTDGKKGSSSSAKTEMEDATEKIPEWAKPGSEELPPWARNEAANPKEQAQDLPFFVYLIASSLVAIAAVGSVFEYFNKNAIFGVVPPESPFWAPILGIFVFTGFPSAGFLWFKAISLANKASEEQDREDGYER